MAEESLRGKRVLIVEDWLLVADAVQSMLEGMGAVVVGPAPNVAQAMSLLETEALDAAVLDVNLEHETAYPVAEALEKRGVPFLFATGYDDDVIPPQFVSRPRVVKPFTTHALRHAIVQAISKVDAPS